MNQTDPVTSDLLNIVDTAASVNERGEVDEPAKEEAAALKKNVKEYEAARAFDKDARRQYAIDRRYAAGTADRNWAVSTNLIGSFIDILVAFLYARNPDVNIKKAPQVSLPPQPQPAMAPMQPGIGAPGAPVGVPPSPPGLPGAPLPADPLANPMSLVAPVAPPAQQLTAQTQSKDMETFAKTAEIIMSRLWRDGQLKVNCRRAVRSALSTGAGWIKVILICDNEHVPQMNQDLQDIRDNIAALEALQVEIGTDMNGTLMGDATYTPQVGGKPGDECTLSPEEYDAKVEEMRQQQEAVAHKVEAALRKYLAVDFIPSECMQVSLDCRYLSDFKNANWVSNDIYRTVDEAKALFPRLSEADIKKAKKYYQKRSSTSPVIDPAAPLGWDNNALSADDADQFTAGLDGQPASESNADAPSFVKITERWNKRTNHVETVIDGVEKWAVEPYQPEYGTTRFYPYFLVSFYEVDGERHGQSLSWRLSKLADEYNRSRSSFRLLRQRAQPATIFNKGALSEEDVRKIEGSVEQEYIGVMPVDPSTPIQNIFAAKPVERPDPRLYDNTMILQDMEKISGVQEALQSSSSPEKTATEAEIQQSGFSSRTNADRDTLEDMLNDLATYTLQLAIQGITPKDAQRMAGPAAFWPHGMSLDDLLTLVELEVAAGSTGKPRAMGDREAWGVLLPQIKEAIVQIQTAYATGNTGLGDAVKELLRETMVRMGDDTDIDRFIPAAPVAPAPIVPPAGGPVSTGTPPIPPGPVDPMAGGASDLPVPSVPAV